MKAEAQQPGGGRRSDLDRSLAPQSILRPSAHFGVSGSTSPLAISPPAGQPRRPPPRRRSKQQVSARAAVATSWLGYLAALALPLVAWHHTIGVLASGFRFDLGHLSGWLGYGLIVAGLLVLARVLVSLRSAPDSRLRPTSPRAYVSWGVVLYLLGLALASQVAALIG